MNKFGVDSRDAIAVNVERTRHSLTRTYKGRNNSILKDNETPREALARDIKNMKDIYRYEKKDLLKRNKNETDAEYNLREKAYESNLRKSLKERRNDEFYTFKSSLKLFNKGWKPFPKRNYWIS